MTSSNNTHQASNSIEAFLRLPRVLHARGDICQATQYADVAAGLYTKPVKIAARAVGWPVSEVAALNAARIAGKSLDEIRALVKRLEAARAAMA